MPTPGPYISGKFKGSKIAHEKYRCKVDSIIHTLDFDLPTGEDSTLYQITFQDMHVQSNTVDICTTNNICPNWDTTNTDGLFEAKGLDITLKNEIDLKKIGGNR